MIEINNSFNASMLGVEILSLKYPELRAKLVEHKKTMKEDFIKEIERGCDL